MPASRGFLPSGSRLRQVYSPNPDHPSRVVRDAELIRDAVTYMLSADILHDHAAEPGYVARHMTYRAGVVRSVTSAPSGMRGAGTGRG